MVIRSEPVNRGSVPRLASAAAAMVACLMVSLAAQQGTTGGEWRSHGGDPASTKYAPLDQITKANVSQLRIAWRRPAVDPSLVRDMPNFSFSHDFRATPLMVDGVLYSSNGVGLVEAFNPGTGATLWVQQPFSDEFQHRRRPPSERAAAAAFT